MYYETKELITVTDHDEHCMGDDHLERILQVKNALVESISAGYVNLKMAHDTTALWYSIIKSYQFFLFHYQLFENFFKSCC